MKYIESLVSAPASFVNESTYVVQDVFDSTFVAALVVKDGAEIRLMGFGTFKKQHRDARKGRNPQTGAEMEIAASDSLSFKSNVKY